MPQLTAGQPPPRDYYAHILQSITTTVTVQYADILSEDEATTIRSIQGLKTDALRLLARLATRSKPNVRLDSLKYSEIQDLPTAIEALKSSALISVNQCGDLLDLLNLLNMKELKIKFPKVPLGLKKAEMLESILDGCDEVDIRTRLRDNPGWIHLSFVEHLSLFRLLFFGNPYQEISDFVVRDLGITRYEDYELVKDHRFFNSREMLDRYIELTILSEAVDEFGSQITEETADTFLQSLREAESDRLLERRRNKLLNSLGRNLERANLHGLALECYQYSTLHPARERTMRILAKQKQTSRLEIVRKRILSQPYSLEEKLFAQTFGQERNANIKVRTDERQLIRKPSRPIEEHAIDEIGEEGGTAFHLENATPNMLFGLVYWEWLFAPVRGAFVNPFQSSPLDVFWPEFFDVRQTLCSDPLSEPYLLKERLQQTANEKRGVNNSFVPWSIISNEILFSILESLTDTQLTSIIQVFTSDIRQFRSGFPDLTVIDQSGSIRFVEVKGPGDQLRPNQRIWLDQLQVLDIPAEVRVYRLS